MALHRRDFMKTLGIAGVTLAIGNKLQAKPKEKNKIEWAFDYTGHIYPCTATVGKKDESLGIFYPEVTLNNERINEWEIRDVTTIPQCKDCNVQLACGGGCGSVAKNKSGSICSSDCRPVKELLELGFSAYFEKVM